MKMQIFRDAEAPEPQAVRAGDLIFIGGLMAADRNGNIVAADATGQTRAIFERLAALLEQAGASLADVVKHNIYFSCDGDSATVSRFLDELDGVRAGYFIAPGPTTTEIRCGLDRQDARLMV